MIDCVQRRLLGIRPVVFDKVFRKEWVRKLIRILAFVLSIHSLCGESAYARASTAYDPKTFNQQLEFPNYYLPKQYRNLPSEKIPSEILTHLQNLVEQAYSAVADRVTLNVVNEGKIENRRVFQFLDQTLAHHGVPLEINPSGGLVRGIDAYVYDLLKTHQAEDPEVVLESIIHDAKPISIFDIKGLGSDFDVLYQNTHHLTEEAVKKGVGIIEHSLNSVESHLGLRESTNADKKIFVTVGDVKEYGEQLTRAGQQGGSVMDLLAIDRKNKKILTPNWIRKDAGNGVEDIVTGKLVYLDPVNHEVIEDAAKQTLRGVRGLTELPWRVLTPDSELRLKQNLESISDGTVSFTKKAAEQAKKTFKNARYAGNHNRFHRSLAGSVEELTQQVLRQHDIRIPYYSAGEPLELRLSSEMAGFPQHLLMNARQIEQHSLRTLYHGTSMESAAYITRGSFLKSINSDAATNFGTAVLGDGTYFAFERASSEFYANHRGSATGEVPGVFEAHSRNDPKLRVFDLDDPKVFEDPFIQKRLKAHQGDLRNLINELTKEFPIDQIKVNNYLLLQNSQAILLEDPIRNLLLIRLQGIEDLSHRGLATLKNIKTYQEYVSYGAAVSLKVNEKAVLSSRNFSQALENSLRVVSKKCDLNVLNQELGEIFHYQNTVAAKQGKSVYPRLKKLIREGVCSGKIGYDQAHLLDQRLSLRASRKFFSNKQLLDLLKEKYPVLKNKNNPSEAEWSKFIQTSDDFVSDLRNFDLRLEKSSPLFSAYHRALSHLPSESARAEIRTQMQRLKPGQKLAFIDAHRSSLNPDEMFDLMKTCVLNEKSKSGELNRFFKFSTGFDSQRKGDLLAQIAPALGTSAEAQLKFLRELESLPVNQQLKILQQNWFVDSKNPAYRERLERLISKSFSETSILPPEFRRRALGETVNWSSHFNEEQNKLYFEIAETMPSPERNAALKDVIGNIQDPYLRNKFLDFTLAEKSQLKADMLWMMWRGKSSIPFAEHQKIVKAVRSLEDWQRASLLRELPTTARDAPSQMLYLRELADPHMISYYRSNHFARLGLDDLSTPLSRLAHLSESPQVQKRILNQLQVFSHAHDRTQVLSALAPQIHDPGLQGEFRKIVNATQLSPSENALLSAQDEILNSLPLSSANAPHCPTPLEYLKVVVSNGHPL